MKRQREIFGEDVDELHDTFVTLSIRTKNSLPSLKKLGDMQVVIEKSFIKDCLCLLII